jgi:nitrogen-specific signal transduction histidine kinase
MKTLNTQYSSKEALIAYINKHQIHKHPKILLQIFTGNCDEGFIAELIRNVKDLVPQIKIIGSTTDGEICDDKVTEYATILSFSLFDKTEIKTYASAKASDCFDTAKNLIAQFEGEKKPRVAISFADGIDTNGEKYLNAFTEYDKDLIVSGGLAGDNAAFSKTIIFTENEVLTTGAVVALLYNDDLIVNTQANFGWQSIGKTLKVTKAEENVVYEIDGMSPVALYAKYLGDDIMVQLPKTGIEFPLIMHRDGLEVARAVIGKNEDGSLVFAGNLSVGDTVKFGYGNVDAIIEGGNRVYNSIHDSPSESLFIYSCMARKALMGKNITTELKLLSTLNPLSGFFTYGEFFTNIHAGHNELMNQTMTILSLSESGIQKKTKKQEQEQMVYEDASLTAKALSHLVAQTSKELEEINNSLEEKVLDELEKNKCKDQQLLQQSRMAQMGEMISMIAHQWRQPLAAIASTSIDLKMKLAFDNFDLNEVTQQKSCQDYFDKQLNSIESYVQNLTTTIDDFRNFYKPNKETKKVLIHEPIQKSISIIAASAKANGVEMVTQFTSQKVLALYDSELMQVFLNIIKNAQDNFKEKGIKSGKIDIYTYDLEEGVGVDICDNGGGIPSAIISKIFDPYFSTKDEKNGTGLGLYMSKTIIQEHHHGRLSVKNRGDGVCFTIMIKGITDDK